DLHLQSIKSYHKKLVNKLNKLKPDIIFFTGDICDRKRHLELVDEFLTSIDHSIKKVAILGNWENKCGLNIDKLRTVYKKHNCDLLVNQSRNYIIKNTSIQVTGVDDIVEGKPDFKLAVSNYISSDYHFVLAHCPVQRDVIKQQMNSIPVDLVISGHTHGGQINLFGYTPIVPSGSGDYLKGWYKDSIPHLYVSKGIGTTVLPLRFGSRAEIAIFNFEQKIKA
ncbi:MAG: metallophosphoesterase, partial [Daejeonella sp.]|nr:metallophosphoesterase [Daejeonella sp.]